MRLILYLVLILGFTPALAAPEVYSVHPDLSTVRFRVPVGPDFIRGTLPFSSAILVFDPASPESLTLAVTLDASGAEAGFREATLVMRGESFLNTAVYRQIFFISTKATKTAAGLGVDGDITLRGVTQPAHFDVRIDARDASLPTRLTIEATGSIALSAFGASRWFGLVGDEVTLDILAVADKAR
jgi:polyisoprenoid-binding protein YceI